MTIEAINEQLLRAVGVGVALIDESTLTIRFQNDVFKAWFDSSDRETDVSSVFPDLDITELRAAVNTRGTYATETRSKKKRRTLIVAQVFTKAQIGDETLIVLESQNITRIRELESMIESYSAMVERNTREIQREKEQVEKLLLNIMPRGAYEEYKSFGVVAPQRFDSVSVLNLGLEFGEMAEDLAPATFVGELNELYNAFDRIGEQFGCERIKTTGDTYLCVAGVTDPTIDHAESVANTATRFLRYLARRNTNSETKWECRIGLGSGSVIGSVVGVQKYVYDVFGEAVRVAGTAREMAGLGEALAHSNVLEKLNGNFEVLDPTTKQAKQQGLMALGNAV